MPVSQRPEQQFFEDLVAQIVRWWAPLPDKPEETPQSALRALWMTAAGKPVSVSQAAHEPLPELGAEGRRQLCSLLERRMQGEPLAHLTGRQEFLGLELLAGPHALIPRKETEILGRAALAKLEALAGERGALRVLDLCTGSGNLALAYAHYEPRARVYASDIAPEAVALAARNCALLALEDRVEFRAGDLFAPFEQAPFLAGCDLVSCNPPYIPAAKVAAMHREIAAFEPSAAFDGGAYGIAVLTRLLSEAPRFLKPGSWLAFEVGAGQGPALVKRLEKNRSFASVEPCCDPRGEIRALLARAR